MESQFSYARIQVEVGKNLDKEIAALRDAFPRVIGQCYPLEIKRKQVSSMSVYRDTPIYEWSSLSRWGQVLPSFRGPSALVTSVLESNQAGELLPCLDTIAIEKQNTIKVEGRLASEVVGLGVSIWIDEPKLSIRFSLPSQIAEAKQKQLVEFWSQLQSFWAPLSRFSVSFAEEPGQTKRIVVIENSEKGSLCRVEFTQNAEIASQRGFLSKLLQKLAESLKDYKEMCINVFDDSNVVAASKLFEEALGAHSYYYYAHPLKGFHPDQLWGETPTEGFWHIPLFKIRPGRHSESEATVFLVQTDKERWFEIQTADLHSQAELPKYLEQASLPYSIEFWKGPTKERWGLHKLLKKK